MNPVELQAPSALLRRHGSQASSPPARSSGDKRRHRLTLHAGRRRNARRRIASSPPRPKAVPRQGRRWHVRFDFNKKLNRRLVFELAAGHFVAQHADGLFLGPPGTGKSHLAQAIGFAVIQQGHRVCYREAHMLLEELADAQLAGTRKAYLRHVTTVPLLILDDLGMKRLPHTAAEDLLEIVMRRYERASTLITSNRPVEDWGKLLGDTAAVTALLDRLLHHAHVLTCGPRSWRTRLQSDRSAS